MLCHEQSHPHAPLPAFAPRKIGFWVVHFSSLVHVGWEEAGCGQWIILSFPHLPGTALRRGVSCPQLGCCPHVERFSTPSHQPWALLPAARKESWAGRQGTWVQTLVLLLTYCVTTGKCLKAFCEALLCAKLCTATKKNPTCSLSSRSCPPTPSKGTLHGVGGRH